MAIDMDELLPKKKKAEFALGEDLSTLSEHELAARITSLEEEIVRCREAMSERQSTRAAADNFFRKD